MIVSGPQVVVHDQTINPTHSIMAITSKSTKAEILEAYVALRDNPTTADDVLQWLAQTAQIVYKETVLLAKDCYRAGQLTRKWYDQVVADLSRPIIKP
jgi:hypothetical protein